MAWQLQAELDVLSEKPDSSDDFAKRNAPAGPMQSKQQTEVLASRKPTILSRIEMKPVCV